MTRKAYPTDVSDEEWSFAAPYLTLMSAPWRLLPNDFPPWEAVYQQSRRWVDSGCFEAMVSDLRSIIRVAQGRQSQPSAAVMDARTLQSSCESGPRAGYDGYKRRRGSKVHMDTLGHLLAVHVTPANEQERTQVRALCEAVQEATGDTVKLAWVDQGYTGEQAKEAAQDNGIALEVVKLPEAKKGFVLLPRRWVVERSFGWLARFRRLARDYERLPTLLSGLHFLVFAMLMLPAAARILAALQVHNTL